MYVMSCTNRQGEQREGLGVAQHARLGREEADARDGQDVRVDARVGRGAHDAL